MESDILDLPQPLGPIMAETPFSKVKTVLSAKDLNPHSSNFFKYIICFS